MTDLAATAPAVVDRAALESNVREMYREVRVKRVSLLARKP